MPDISAIDAVLNYEKNNYLFMVADPNNKGYHLFARNLSEHNKNKRVTQLVNDYDVDNFSIKVVRIIVSYVDYVNRNTWKKIK